jgi:integrating conjugative element protein (TIGR03749 family)
MMRYRARLGWGFLAAILAPLLRAEPALPPLPDPLAGAVLPAGDPPERLVWNKRPLSITLPVGQERLIMFPVPIRLGLPPELGPEHLRTQIVDGTIYWTALQEFGNQRLQVQARDSGNVYLVDLAASAAAPAGPPIEVAVPESPVTGAALPAVSAAPAGPVPVEPPPPKPLDYVALARLAAQHLYAPVRLHHRPEGVHAVPVRGDSTVALLRGGAIEATPLAAWRSGNRYVTAVRLRNRTPDAVLLDPRRLRGRWLACAFQHGRLARRGDPRDTTAAYLISDRPYAEALDGR